VAVNDGSIGSLSGGGRYDNLTGVFGLADVPGVGFSLGVDRIYDVMANRGLFDSEKLITTRLLLVPMDEQAFQHALPMLATLRKSGIPSELFHEPSKLKKQLAYANKKGIPYVLLIGSNEISEKKYTLKSMISGEQESLDLNQLISRISSYE
jgi:histidyl-tRNA synthetase